VALEAAGVPTVAVHTHVFARLVRSVAMANGMPTLRQAFVPQPVVGRTPAELRAYIEGTDPINNCSFIESVIGGLTRPLEGQDLAAADLAQYDAIVTDTRAYAVRDDLRTYNRRLLDYVQQGGNLIVLYNTQEFVPNLYAPFPGQLPARAEEVSEEDSPVEILTHPADDFVAQFVGADRALKRLALSSVGDLELLDSAPDAASSPVLIACSW